MASGSQAKTKDWFKNQLVSHGIPLPASSARKEEYQRLYEEQVLPHQNNAEFSSDDDTEQTRATDESQRTATASSTKSAKSDGTKDDTVGNDKYSAWIATMSDQIVFDALSACERNPGPIVDTTRNFYRRMLAEELSNDERKVLAQIENYLDQQPEAKERWVTSGVDLQPPAAGPTATNGTTTLNGNTENGYSDSDDDEAVETASRASRSSSKRATPARPVRTPVKVTAASTPLSSFRSDTEIRSRVSSLRNRDGLFDLTNDTDEPMDEVPGPSASSGLFSGISSPSAGYRSKPSGARKRTVESYEETHVYRESSTSSSQLSTQKMNTSGRSKRQAVFVLLFLAIVVILGYMFYVHQTPADTASPESGDELDMLLKTMDENEKVQDAAGGF